jgi:hypothetical protein
MDFLGGLVDDLKEKASAVADGVKDTVPGLDEEDGDEKKPGVCRTAVFWVWEKDSGALAYESPCR